MGWEVEGYRITISNGQGQVTHENCHRPRIKNNVVSFWRDTELDGLGAEFKFFIGNPSCSVLIETESEE